MKVQYSIVIGLSLGAMEQCEKESSEAFVKRLINHSLYRSTVEKTSLDQFTFAHAIEDNPAKIIFSNECEKVTFENIIPEIIPFLENNSYPLFALSANKNLIWVPAQHRSSMSYLCYDHAKKKCYFNLKQEEQPSFVSLSNNKRFIAHCYYYNGKTYLFLTDRKKKDSPTKLLIETDKYSIEKIDFNETSDVLGIVCKDGGPEDAQPIKDSPYKVSLRTVHKKGE